MNRREARQVALRALFQVDLGGANPRDALIFASEGIASPDFTDEGFQFALQLLDGVIVEKDALDAMIKPLLRGWQMDRLPSLDLQILRLGAYELRYLGTPQSAVINEWIELAKEYSTRDSAKFVNGVLGMLAKSANPEN